MLKTIHIQTQSGVASYYVNSEHITHFYGEAESGKSYLVIYFVGGAYSVSYTHLTLPTKA